jgi:predicted neutral ceramidase superfamily lipid hydrolase
MSSAGLDATILMIRPDSSSHSCYFLNDSATAVTTLIVVPCVVSLASPLLHAVGTQVSIAKLVCLQSSTKRTAQCTLTGQSALYSTRAAVCVRGIRSDRWQTVNVTVIFGDAFSAPQNEN